MYNRKALSNPNQLTTIIAQHPVELGMRKLKDWYLFIKCSKCLVQAIILRCYLL